jgi:hypothetical protein
MYLQVFELWASKKQETKLKTTETLFVRPVSSERSRVEPADNIRRDLATMLQYTNKNYQQLDRKTGNDPWKPNSGLFYQNRTKLLKELTWDILILVTTRGHI